MPRFRLLDGKGAVLLDRVEAADTARLRMRGLLGRDGLEAGCGLFIPACGAVHTFGMRFTLDLIFVDGGMTVRRVVRGVPPNRVVFGGRGATGVLEMQAGCLAEGRVAEGDGLQLRVRGPE